MFCYYLNHKSSSWSSMNPGVPAGPSTSAASPPATLMSRPRPPATARCSPIHRSTRTTRTLTRSTLSSPTAPTATPPSTTCGPATAGGPARSRTCPATEPAPPSLSSATYWVSVELTKGSERDATHQQLQLTTILIIH